MSEPAGNRRAREIADEGDIWVVKERNAQDDVGAPGRRCLVFMSESTVRRVWHYPSTWYELSDRALLALANAQWATRSSGEGENLSAEDAHD